MPKEPRILPDMLLTVFKKGYFCYLIALCYVIVALLSAFCLHCHTTKQRRTKRGLPMSCGVYCQDCDLSGNGCLSCADSTFLFTEQANSQSVTKCVAECPKSYYSHYSRIEPSTCKSCRVAHCASCDGAPSHCNECEDNYYQLKQNGRVSCVDKCPKGFKNHPKRRKCLPKNRTKCKVSSWIPIKPRVCVCHKGRWQIKVKTRTIKSKRKEKCNKNLEKWRDCRPPRHATCTSSNSFQTNSRGHKRRGRHRINNSRRRKDSLKHGGRGGNNIHNSNNYKTRHGHSTGGTNQQSIQNPAIVT